MKSELLDRVLWFDGTSQVAPEQVADLILSGIDPGNLVVTHHSEDTTKFNQLATEQLLDYVDLENWVPDTSWKIPVQYGDMDIAAHLTTILLANPQFQAAVYTKRLSLELDEIRKRGMGPLIQTLIFVIDTFRQKNVIWGVGRGSSCASLVLYLIGVHLVDPVFYGIPMEEFYHD